MQCSVPNRKRYAQTVIFMAKKHNPLTLNPLQLRTLTLLQALAALPEHSAPGAEPGSARIEGLPQPHGDHFHLGPWTVLARDATGIANEAAWMALQRQGLIKATFPIPLARSDAERDCA